MASRKTGGTSANAKRPKDSNGAVGHLRGKAKTPWEEITSDGYFYPLSIVYADIHKMTGTLILSHFTYSPLMILRFLQIEGLWQSYVKQVCWHHFSNIFSLHSSVKFWQFPWCFECFHYYICYGDLCSGIFDVTIAKRLPFAEGSDDG